MLALSGIHSLKLEDMWLVFPDLKEKKYNSQTLPNSSNVDVV